MKRNVVAMLLCTAMLLTTLTGCQSKASKEKETGNNSGTVNSEDSTKKEETKSEQATEKEEKVKLSIYAQYADDDTKIPYDYAVEQLAIAYPNVELELIVQAQDDGMTLSTLAASRNLPDIFQAGTEIISSFKETNQVMVLNDIAKSTGFADKVFDSCQEFLYHEDGNVYAFPYAGQEYVLWYYNKAIFEQYNLEVPTTYEELLHCIQVFRENDIIPMALFGQEGWISTAFYDVVATRYDVGGIKKLDSGNGSITEEAYVKAAETVHNLVKAGMFQSDVTITNYDQASAMFLEGKAAMFLNGQWYIEDATKALGDNVDWMYYPSYDEASYEAGKAAFSGGGSAGGYAVNPESKHAELAAEVAAFISEKYCEAKVLYRSNPLVAVDVDVTAEKPLSPMMQKLSDAIPEITSTTKFTWGLTNSIFNAGIMDHSQFLLLEQYKVEEFIEEVDAIMGRMNE